MWLLLIPLVIVLVVMLTIGSLFAGLFWLVGSAWPWLLIAVGAWLFWHEDGRHNRRRRANAAAPVRVAQQPQPIPIRRKTRPPGKSELPIDVQVKVEQIRRKVDVLLGFADRFPPFSKDLYLVRQTASEYLPRTINAYLALAPDATERPLATSGQTPHQELKAQLDLLDAKLDEIALDLERQDVQRLLANRQFLEDRFGAAAPSAEDNSGITTPADRFGPPTSRSA